MDLKKVSDYEWETRFACFSLFACRLSGACGLNKYLERICVKKS